ncbi:MAG: hypothetical protein ACRCV0_00840 [Brevinema sp.]
MIHVIQQKLSNIILDEFNMDPDHIHIMPLSDKEYFSPPYVCILAGKATATNSWGNPQYHHHEKFQQKFTIRQPIVIKFSDSTYEFTTDFVDKLLSVLPRYLNIEGRIVEISPQQIHYVFSPGELDLFNSEIDITAVYDIFSKPKSVNEISSIGLDIMYVEQKNGS